MLVVSVPEVPFPGVKFARPTLGDFLGWLVVLFSIVVLSFYYMGFVAIFFGVFFILPVMILTIRDFFRKLKEPPPEPYQDSAAVVFRKDYFVVANRYSEEGKYYYVREHVPIWGDVCPYHDVIFSVYIPCRYSGEQSTDDEVRGSYELICRSAEEAQWVLHEVEVFLRSNQIVT